MKIELDYVKVGDYYLPDLTAEPRPDRSLGKYGLMRLRYLKEHRPVVWAKLVMDGKLYAHLLEVEDTANDLLDNITFSPIIGGSITLGMGGSAGAEGPIAYTGVLSEATSGSCSVFHQICSRFSLPAGQAPA